MLIARYLWIFLMAFSISQDCNSQIVINEFLASNLGENLDEEGEDDDWLELRNITDEVISTAGFWLSDSSNDPVKWSLPIQTLEPGELRVVWCDKDLGQSEWHSNFKLNKQGGCIYLGAGNELIDEICYSEQRTNYSLGRTSVDQAWAFFDQPTPGWGNPPQGMEGFTQKPSRSHEQGYYVEPFLLELQVQDEAEIYYRIGGGKPNSASTKYNDAISIDSNTVVRFFAQSENKYDSEIFTQTFIIESEKQLPSVFVAMNPDDLFHASYGIYAEGNNFFFWEREHNISLLENAQTQFQLDAGIAISGGSTRNNPQKSFNIKTKAKYGSKKLNFPLFEDSQRDEYEGFRLRISGNDNDRVMFRDALMHELIDTTFNFTQNYRPVVLFLNGEYWGIYNIREKHDPHYFKEKYDIEIQDLIDQTGGAKIGDTLFYGQIKEYFKENNLQETAVYDSALQLIDVNNFMDYYIAQIFYANSDWLDNNTKVFREQNGKMKWAIFDTDLGFAFAPRWGHPGGVDHNTLRWALNCCEEPDLHNSPKSTLIFRGFMENGEFRKRFLTRFNYHLNHTFCSDRVLAKIEEMAARIESEIPLQCLRWVDEIVDLTTWNDNIEIMRDFARKRPQIVADQLIDYFELDGFSQPDLHVYPLDAGTVTVDWDYDFASAHASCSFRLFHPSSLQLSAQPAPNFGFEAWSSELGTAESIDWEWSTDQSLTAFFQSSSAQGGDDLFRIFPNPCMNYLQIQAAVQGSSSNPSSGFFRLLDSMGRNVWQSEVTHLDFYHEKINFQHLPEGLYLLQLLQGGRNSSIEFIKH